MCFRWPVLENPVPPDRFASDLLKSASLIASSLGKAESVSAVNCPLPPGRLEDNCVFTAATAACASLHYVPPPCAPVPLCPVTGPPRSSVTVLSRKTFVCVCVLVFGVS